VVGFTIGSRGKAQEKPVKREEIIIIIIIIIGLLMHSHKIEHFPTLSLLYNLPLPERRTEIAW
jgi:hypothetical protein